jgi:hypothetical protein
VGYFIPYRVYHERGARILMPGEGQREELKLRTVPRPGSSLLTLALLNYTSPVIAIIPYFRSTDDGESLRIS